MRVPFNAGLREAEAQVARVESQFLARQRELTSGRRLNALSDDPHGAASAVAQRSTEAKLDSYTRAVGSVEAKLTLADTVLNDVVSKVTAALSTAAGAKTTEKTPDQQEAIAVELEAIRDDVFSDVTTQFHGNFLFAGAATTTQPYTQSAAGVVSGYQGDDTVVSVDIDRQTAVPVSFSGDELLAGSDTDDFFAEIDQLIAAVRADNQTDIDTGMSALDRQFDRAVLMQSRVGTDLNRLENHRAILAAMQVGELGRLSKLEDVDLVEAISGMQQAQQVREAAIRAIGTRLPLSIFHFVR